MKQKPRNPKDSVFAHGLAASMVFYGVLVGIITLAAFLIGEYVFLNEAAANTMAFATLVFCELTRAFAVRSERMSVFQIGLFSNKTMNKAFVVGLLLQLAVLLIPFLQPVFHIVPLNGMEWLTVVGLSFVPLIVSEIAKVIRRSRG